MYRFQGYDLIDRIEASLRLCPFMSDGQKEIKCCTTNCMAWQTVTQKPFTEVIYGFCKRIGTYNSPGV